MRYVLPAAPNVCSYTTLAKTNCKVSTCLTADTGFISAKVFLIPMPHPYVNAHGGQFEHLL